MIRAVPIPPRGIPREPAPPRYRWVHWDPSMEPPPRIRRPATKAQTAPVRAAVPRPVKPDRPPRLCGPEAVARALTEPPRISPASSRVGLRRLTREAERARRRPGAAWKIPDLPASPERIEARQKTDAANRATVDAVLEAMSVTREGFHGSNRQARNIVARRQCVAILRASAEPPPSFPAIGRATGRGHGMVMSTLKAWARSPAAVAYSHELANRLGLTGASPRIDRMAFHYRRLAASHQRPIILPGVHP